MLINLINKHSYCISIIFIKFVKKLKIEEIKGLQKKKFKNKFKQKYYKIIINC